MHAVWRLARTRGIYFLLSVFGAIPADGQQAAAGLPAGWKQTTTLPAVQGRNGIAIRESVITLWAEHSADNDGIEETIKEKGITFPVMIDSRLPEINPRPGALKLAQSHPVLGETAASYATTFLPNYFLIDKSGTVVWGFSIDPPSGKIIEKTLE